MGQKQISSDPITASLSLRLGTATHIAAKINSICQTSIAGFHTAPGLAREPRALVPDWHGFNRPRLLRAPGCCRHEARERRDEHREGQPTSRFAGRMAFRGPKSKEQQE